MRAFSKSLLGMIFVIAGTHAAIAQHTVNKAHLISGDSAKVRRQAIVDRQRRLIFNNDGNEPYNVMTSPSVEEFLKLRTKPLLGSQVDSIFYCSNLCFGLFTHFTEVGQVFSAREGQFKNNQLPAMLKLGIDPLTEMIEFCRQHKIEIFWSMRMNDTHDGANAEYGPIMFKANKLKTDHPEYLLGKYGERIAGGKWSAVNYSLQPIRELAFRYIEEVATNYDVDGIELDFFRHPLFFPSTTQGQPATEEEQSAMTDLLRKIRSRLEELGQQRGKPILLAVRVPDSAEYCHAIGLNVDQWMQAGLIDLMTVCSYFQLHDWKYSADWGHKYGVKVYASLDESRIGDEPARRRRMTTEVYRGRAANVWNAGMDGAYLFNSFDPYSPLWRELGDKNLLAALDKDYFASIRGKGQAAGGNYPTDAFQSCETINPGQPKLLRGGEPTTTRIQVAESKENLRSRDLELRLEFDGARGTEALHVRLNGSELDEQKWQGDWLVLKPSHELLRLGENLVEVTLRGETEEPIQWKDLMLQVRSTNGTKAGEGK